MHLKDWFELVNYRITEGSEYNLNSFPDSYSLSSWDGDHDGSSFNVVFNTKTQEVYTMEACDYRNQRAYRYINPEWSEIHSIGFIKALLGDEAWDSVDFIDLEVYEDFLDKSRAIFDGESYDTRVSIPLALDDSEMFQLMKYAHECDMSLNEFVEKTLRDYIESES
jgi:hypothetical protein